MNGSTTNVTLMGTPLNRQPGTRYGAYEQNNNDYWNWIQPRPPSGALLNVRGPLPVEERVRTGSSGLARASSVPLHSPMDVPVLDNISRQSNIYMQDEQKKASNKLRKGIYNPTRNRIWRSLKLYYRDDAKNMLNEKDKIEEVEDYYSCAICLEEFEPRQEVMVTPCNHVYHGECIVPWVKSSGRCPVCRFAISL